MISVIFASLPEAVLGGCTIMMFGNIIVSGFQMIAQAGFCSATSSSRRCRWRVGIGFTQVFTVRETSPS